MLPVPRWRATNPTRLKADNTEACATIRKVQQAKCARSHTHGFAPRTPNYIRRSYWVLSSTAARPGGGWLRVLTRRCHPLSLSCPQCVWRECARRTARRTQLSRVSRICERRARHRKHCGLRQDRQPAYRRRRATGARGVRTPLLLRYERSPRRTASLSGVPSRSFKAFRATARSGSI